MMIHGFGVRVRARYAELMVLGHDNLPLDEEPVQHVRQLQKHLHICTRFCSHQALFLPRACLPQRSVGRMEGGRKGACGRDLVAGAEDEADAATIGGCRVLARRLLDGAVLQPDLARHAHPAKPHVFVRRGIRVHLRARHPPVSVSGLGGASIV